MIRIPKAIYTLMIEHAQSLAPIESCGYLSGVDQDIKTFYPMTNVDNSPEHFSFDPKEQFKVLKQARGSSEQLLAVYHSHPASPARLSQEDIRLFNDPNTVYIIVSLAAQQPEVKAYRILKSDQEVTIESVSIQVL